jgi:hypothetical protein
MVLVAKGPQLTARNDAHKQYKKMFTTLSLSLTSIFNDAPYPWQLGIQDCVNSTFKVISFFHINAPVLGGWVLSLANSWTLALSSVGLTPAGFLLVTTVVVITIGAIISCSVRKALKDIAVIAGGLAGRIRAGQTMWDRHTLGADTFYGRQSQPKPNGESSQPSGSGTNTGTQSTGTTTPSKAAWFPLALLPTNIVSWLNSIDSLALSIITLSLIALTSYFYITGYVVSFYVIEYYNLVNRFPSLSWLVKTYRGINSIFLVLHALLLLLTLLLLLFGGYVMACESLASTTTPPPSATPSPFTVSQED